MTITASGMLIGLFLDDPAFGDHDPGPMPLRKGVKGLDLSAFLKPVLLTQCRALLGGSHHCTGLLDCLVESAQEEMEIPPRIRPQPIGGGRKKSCVIFVPIGDQQAKPLAGLLLPGDQLTQLAGGFIKVEVG